MRGDGSEFYRGVFGTPFGVGIAFLMGSAGLVIGLVKLWAMFF